MRTVGLIILIVLFPIFAHAAVALININTADASTLDGLPYITPDTAAAIIAYRTAHGPFASIEDIQNVNGIKSGIFSHIQSLITIGDTPSSTPDTSVASSTMPTETSSGGTTTYMPPPSALSVSVSGEENALKEVPDHFSARATLKNGAIDPAARILWSFGDGSGGEGSAVEKTYRHMGTYLVVVTASDGSASAKDDLSVTVKPSQVRISAVSGEGVTLTNDASERLDLSGWRLGTDASSFRFPDGTTLLPQASVLFPYEIINIPSSLDAMLLYPNGILAARSASPAVLANVATTMDVVAATEQPSAETTSYISVQKVEPITSARTTVQSYDEAVNAPATTPDVGAAAGAAFAPAAPALAAVTAAPAVKTATTGLFHSVWSLGLVGVMALAGGAFILL